MSVDGGEVEGWGVCVGYFGMRTKHLAKCRVSGSIYLIKTVCFLFELEFNYDF